MTSRGVLVRPSLPLPSPLPGLKFPIPYFSLTSLSIPPLAAIMYAESEVSESEVTQSCPTLGNPMDYSLPGSSLHGILQARVLEWVATPGDLPNSGIEPGSPTFQADALTSEPPGKPKALSNREFWGVWI